MTTEYALPSSSTSPEWAEERWKPWRDTAADYFDACGSYKIGDKLRNCCHPLFYSHAAVCTCNRAHVQPLLHTCKVIICPYCNRAAAIQNTRVQYLPAALAAWQARIPDFSFKFATFTTSVPLYNPDCRTRLREGFDQVRKTLHRVCYAQLLETLSPKERRKGELSWAKHHLGYLIGSFCGAHRKLHYHVTFYGPVLPFDSLQGAWMHYTGDSSVVKVQSINLHTQPFADGLRKALQYTVGLEAVAPKDAPALYQVLHGNRRTRAYGKFWGQPHDASHQLHCRTCGAPTERRPRYWVEGDDPYLDI